MISRRQRLMCISDSFYADVIVVALDALLGELQALREGLESSDDIDRVFDSAGRWRSQLAALRASRDKA